MERTNEQKEIEKEIAATIMNQIRDVGGPWVLGALGVRDVFFLARNDKRSGGVQFSCRGKKVMTGGRCLIELMPNDTYTVTVGRVRKSEFKVLGTADDVHHEMLCEILDDLIG